MPDEFSSWLDRADRFVQSLADSNRGFVVQRLRKPPASDDEVSALDKSIPAGLPGSVEVFLRTASMRCQITYRWKFGESQLASIGDLLPHRYSFYGGPRFFNLQWMRTYDADRARWADDAIEPPTRGL
jgi:hypothetical protein